MQQLQRDVGRVEAKVEIMSDDLKAVKGELVEIRKILGGKEAVTASDYKRFGFVAVLASLVTSIFNWVKPFIT